jgi:hypothetical protein
MRKNKQTLAKRVQQLAVIIVFQNRRLISAFAGIIYAAVNHIDEAAIGRGFYGGNRSPVGTPGQFTPVPLGLVGLGQVIAYAMGDGHRGLRKAWEAESQK